MNKIDVEMSQDLDERVFQTKLKNGLSIYICQKKGYQQKIGMFGTKYGSLTNHFVDIQTNQEVKVPDGIAHFLEHKLFEKEGDNALDLFSKMGVDSNAYTTFDHTVFYFNTTDQLEKSIQMLIKLIKEPYFTDENVKKEQGIIAQEIMMYQDDPSYRTFFNTIKAMYQKNNIKVDVLGTVDSIMQITKENLYTCYHTFYHPSNMFFVLVGDIEVEESIQFIENELHKYEKDHRKQGVIQKFYEEEPLEISKERITEKMEVFMPQIGIGYKLKPLTGNEIVKRAMITDMIADMYFSRMTDFFQEEYEKGILKDKIFLSYEAEDTFAHLIFSAESLALEVLEKDLLAYIERIKTKKVDENLFEQIKHHKLGSMILSSDAISNSYRRVIDAILTNTNVYEDIEIVKNLTVEDISNFLNELEEDKRVVSIINNG